MCELSGKTVPKMVYYDLSRTLHTHSLCYVYLFIVFIVKSIFACVLVACFD